MCADTVCFSVVFGWTLTIWYYADVLTSHSYKNILHFCRRKLCWTKSLIDSFQKFIVFNACSVDLCIIWIDYWLCNCMGSSLFLASDQLVRHQLHDKILYCLCIKHLICLGLFQDDNIRNQRENVVLTLANAQSRLGLLDGTEPVSSLFTATNHLV